MYVVNSTKWDTARLSGHEKLVVDAWLEVVDDDCDPVWWTPIFSVFQLVRNLLAILEEVVNGSLMTYHVTHVCEEILFRLEQGTWLEDAYAFDIQFLKEKLRWAQARTTDHADDVRARSEIASFLRAFIHKVEADQPWQWQLQLLCDKAAEPKPSFNALTRSVADLVNELMHQEHSRSHLNRWILRQVVHTAGPQTYLEHFRVAAGLYVSSKRAFDVMFQVASPATVTDSARIRFSAAIPSGWALDPSSIFLRDTRRRFAVVRVNSARDSYAAIVHARVELSRFLWSMKFDAIEFDRAISKHVAVRDPSNTFIYEEAEPHLLNHRALWNYELLNVVGEGTNNHHTYTALQRILYWIEQTKRVEPVAALISEWTAMEFLFTLPGLRDLDAVEQFVPAYLAIKYPRWLLLDFWRFLQQVRPPFSAELIARIDIRPRGGTHSRASCNLTKLLDACLEDEVTNQLLPLISDYPILLAKWYRVRRLRPGSKALARDLAAFEQRLRFDVRTCYRARNSVVHDAATSISENERVLQRLNWMLCASVDQILFQFSRNPMLGLVDIHRCNRAGWDKWREVVTNASSVCSSAIVVEPPSYFLR